MNKAIILAGGTGTRLGADIPKQYLEYNGKAVISYSLDVFANHENIDEIYIAADKMWHEFILNQCNESCKNKFRSFTTPGKTRQLTILNALEKMKICSGDNDIVIIHDGARPFVTEKIISDCIGKIPEYDGSMPVLPMKDTIYLLGGSSLELLDRNKLFAGQSPEAFIFGKYYEANISLMPDKIMCINGSSEAAIIYGMNVAVVDGDENNFKITTQEDLKKFERILSQKRE